MRHGLGLPVSILTVALMAAILFGAWAAASNRGRADEIAEQAARLEAIDQARNRDVREQRRELAHFLRLSCTRDQKIISVTVTILTRARVQAQARSDQVVVNQLSLYIQQLQTISTECVENLPG